MTITQKPDWNALIATAGPYPVEAFQFVRDGLSFTAERKHGSLDELEDEDRHITGQELCCGLRDLAIERFGLMATVVLNSWTITRTEDFGRIVYAMIDVGIMSKREDDSIDDFQGVYDFAVAFSHDQIGRQASTA